ncbi:MAG: tyrosine-type recombinase/integrase [Stackebrandtia sp.]
MVYIEARPKGAPTSWRVQWRLPGVKEDNRQSCSFSLPDLAGEASELIDAHRRAITDTEVYRVLGERHGDAGAGPDGEAASSLPIFERVVVDTWWLKQLDRAEATRANYWCSVTKHFVPAFGHKPVDLITDQEILQWMATASKECATSTVRGRVKLLKQIFKFISRRYRIPDPLEEIRTPAPDQDEQVFLSPAELDIVASHAAGLMRDLIVVAAHSGLRLGEVLALNVGDIVFTSGGAQVTVSKALKNCGKVGPPKSKASNRIVAVGSVATAVLARLCHGRRDTMPLFTEGGARLKKDWVRSRWNMIVRSARRCVLHPPQTQTTKRGMVYTPRKAVSECDCSTRLHQRPRWHDLRHTHAAWVISAGWAPDEVQKRLGHSNVSITYDFYWHRFRRDEAAAIARLDAYVERASTESPMASHTRAA